MADATFTQYAVRKPNESLHDFDDAASAQVNWIEDEAKANKVFVELCNSLEKSGATEQTVTLLTRVGSINYSAESVHTSKAIG